MIEWFKELHKEIVIMGDAFGKRYIYYSYGVVVSSIALVGAMVWDIINRS